jgi:hypothetical protein
MRDYLFRNFEHLREIKDLAPTGTRMLVNGTSLAELITSNSAQPTGRSADRR